MSDSAGANFYARMFPHLRGERPRPVSDMEEGLAKLGQLMRDEEPEVDPENQPDLPTAGYTYWGQFIDHDLTFDITPLDQASAAVEQVRNYRTAALDLDQLYGDGPTASPFLYEKGYHGAERFLIGETTAANPSDLPRNAQGIALVADPRQDENLIIAQLHVAFLKLHNLVVAQPEAAKTSEHYQKLGSDFAAARRIVTWHYQWLVRHDYLSVILDPEVFASLEEIEADRLGQSHRKYATPVEFSAAVFRFGHSMPRDLYARGVNDQQRNVRLETLLSLTGMFGLTPPGQASHTRLPDEWIVSWEHFFLIPPRVAAVNRARKIDTQIANALHNLDAGTARLFHNVARAQLTYPQLPVRTLLRGFRMQLPSGEQIAAEICRHRNFRRTLKPDEIVDDSAIGAVLKDPRYGLRNNTPLFFYISKEAEVLHNGRGLGPVGSTIVADVIISALAADTASYLHAKGWQPTLTDDQGRKITSMAALLRWIASAPTNHSST